MQEKLDGYIRCLNTPSSPFDVRAAAQERARCAIEPGVAANGKVGNDKMGPCTDGRPRDVVQRYSDFIVTSNDHQFP